MKNLIIGEQYKGVGNCGTHKNIEVVGKLVEISLGFPILEYAKGRTASVNKQSIIKVEPCENKGVSPNSECGDMFDCCDCGNSENGCGCRGCYSCNACETCLEDN